MRSDIISRVTEGFDCVFCEGCREGVCAVKLFVFGIGAWRVGAFLLGKDCWEDSAEADGRGSSANFVNEFNNDGVERNAEGSGESEEGESEPMSGFKGVRKGDLNGFERVFEASFNRRRLAYGVDISAGEGTWSF